MLTVTCEKCQKRYKIDPRLAGKTLKCKVCQHKLVVPPAEPLESDDLMAGLASASQAGTRSQAAPAPAPARSSSKSRPAARPAPAAPAAPACPQCSAALTAGAVICVSCGYSLATGKKLTTTLAREPVSTLRRVTTSGNVSREGGRLVASDASTLPERCVVCNGEEGVTMKNKTYSYIPYWAIFLTGWLIGYLFFRKTSSMTYGMCAKHNKLRSIIGLVAAAALLGAVGLIYYSSQIINTDDRQTCLIAGLVGIPVAVVLALLMPGPRVAHIDGSGIAQYRGCGKKFLESL